jgi:hypothetical protein
LLTGTDVLGHLVRWRNMVFTPVRVIEQIILTMNGGAMLMV